MISMLQKTEALRVLRICYMQSSGGPSRVQGFGPYSYPRSDKEGMCVLQETA